MRIARVIAATVAVLLAGLVGPRPAAVFAATPNPATGTLSVPDRAVAGDAQLSVTGAVTRLVFTLSKPVEARAFVMERPDRLIVDLPEVNFQLAAQTGRKGAGLVAGFRYGLFAPGRSRIVVDLEDPASVETLASRPLPNGLTELVLELRRTDRAAFATAAAAALAEGRAQSPAGAAGGAALPASVDRRPLVVIDPGHGGVDPGAMAAQVAEKSIVLAFGQKLRELLAATGRYRIVMTREDDSFVSLGDRVRLARQNGADLFVSIHADSLSQARDVRGATVYTGSERATDAESARLAARENEVDALAGIETPKEDREDVADILMDLAKRETRLFSANFARLLVGELGGAVRMHKVPQRSAGFRVLTAPDVPSVLIELGYVSSARDVELLTSEKWRTDAAVAMQKAIDGFFRARDGSATGQRLASPSRERAPAVPSPGETP